MTHAESLAPLLIVLGKALATAGAILLMLAEERAEF